MSAPLYAVPDRPASEFRCDCATVYFESNAETPICPECGTYKVFRVSKPLEVVDPADVLLAIDDEIESLQIRRQIPLTLLWETIGKPMLEKGQRTKRLDGYVYHVEPPRDKEYCLCCASLLYQCKTPLNERPGVFVRTDARPSFFITRIREKSDG